MYQLIQSPGNKLLPVGVKVYSSPGQSAQGLLPGWQSADVKVAFCPSVGHWEKQFTPVKITEVQTKTHRIRDKIKVELKFKARRGRNELKEYSDYLVLLRYDNVWF
jgi:hypothetical protein